MCDGNSAPSERRKQGGSLVSGDLKRFYNGRLFFSRNIRYALKMSVLHVHASGCPDFIPIVRMHVKQRSLESVWVWENSWAFMWITKLVTQPDERLCGTNPGCNKNPETALQISRGRTDLRLLQCLLTKFWVKPWVTVLLTNNTNNKHGIALLLQQRQTC